MAACLGSFGLGVPLVLGAARFLVLGPPDIYVEHGGFTPPGAADVATVHNEPLPVRNRIVPDMWPQAGHL